MQMTPGDHAKWNKPTTVWFYMESLQEAGPGDWKLTSGDKAQSGEGEGSSPA